MISQANWYTVSAGCANPAWNILTTISTRWKKSRKKEFATVSQQITELIRACRIKLEENNYDSFREELMQVNALNNQLALLKKEELKRIQGKNSGIKTSMVYLTILQEAQNVVTYTINLMKVSRKFQLEPQMI